MALISHLHLNPQDKNCMPTAAWFLVRPPMPDRGTLGLQFGGWAWYRHPHLERTRLSRNSGNGKSMDRKRAEAPQDYDDDYKKKKKNNNKNNNNKNNNPEDRNLKMTEVFKKQYEMGWLVMIFHKYSGPCLGGACGAYGGGERCAQSSGGET